MLKYGAEYVCQEIEAYEAAYRERVVKGLAREAAELGYRLEPTMGTATFKSNGFGFEPEFTAKVAKRRNPSWRVFEVPISYSGRTYQEGKKIGLRDAATALYCIVRFWLCD